MCGRYSLISPAEAVRRLFAYPERPNLAPRANIAPSQDVAAVRLSAGGGLSVGRHFAWLRWGLVPSWAKDPTIGNRMINARAETVAGKPAFRAAFRARRCLIPADGFYEWRGEGGARQPYRIARGDGAPFALAGLWERWIKVPDGQPVESCAIVTTNANTLVRPIHERMPVILDAADFEAWLDPETAPERALELLRPTPDEGFVAYRVSRRINSPADDEPSLTEPIDSPASGGAPAPGNGASGRLL